MMKPEQSLPRSSLPRHRGASNRASGRAAAHPNLRAGGGSSRAAPPPRAGVPPARFVRRVLATALVLAALVALTALATQKPAAGQVAVVMDASVAHDPTLRAQAQAWLRRSAPAGGARVAARVPAGAPRTAARVPSGAPQQLSVTSTLATRGYDTIVAIGLDRRVALDPVVHRHPDVRVAAWPGGK